MMKYYQDITLLPDAEANLGFLWQKVYQQIHIALAENKIAENQSAIAVSFPKYDDKVFPLGDKLRLFAEQHSELEQFNIAKWLSRLTDYAHITSIKEVPSSVNEYACFKRKQFKSNLIKEAKRRAKYKGETLEDALTHFKDYQKESSLPYINMTSLSTEGERPNNKIFKLFIEKNKADKLEQGCFNCYGLSSREITKIATIPWF